LDKFNKWDASPLFQQNRIRGTKIENNKKTSRQNRSDSKYTRDLEATHLLRKSVICSAIQSFELPEGSHGLDAGCGIGLHLEMLAEAIGPGGTIVGLDISHEFLEYAKKLTRVKNRENQISFQHGNINKIPFEDNTFDWAWSVDCVGYAPGNALPALKELNRVLKPGGKLAILYWSSQQLLPGYPQLEAHLNATSPGIAPFKTGMSPVSHPFRLLSPLYNAGFADLNVHTFAGTVHGPLSEQLRNGLVALLQMRWQNSEKELSSQDQKLFQKLYDPNSPDFILNIPDYYAFFTYSLFSGKVGE